MKTLQIIGLFVLFNIGSPAFAYKGSISFTAAEKLDHASKAKDIAQDASNCLRDHWTDHVDFYNSHSSTYFDKNAGKTVTVHLSRYFGNRRWVKGNSPVTSGERTLKPIRPELKAKGFDPNLEDEMTSMSCIDLSRVCLGESFAKHGQKEYFDRILAFSRLNGYIGTIIQVGLQSLGWKLLYWNPDPGQNAANDAFDNAVVANGGLKSVRGQHAYTYSTVMKKNLYYEYQVDDKTTLVNFGTKPPEAYNQIPFVVGTAHLGYHVFLGSLGEVIEAHSTRNIFGFDNVQLNPFNPLAGVGPKETNSEHYRSGIIVVPPGYL